MEIEPPSPPDDFEEVDYVPACPLCEEKLLGMTPNEYRSTHALEDCEEAPVTSLIVFPTEEQNEQLKD